MSTDTTLPEIAAPAPRRRRVLWKWSLAVTAALFLFLLWQCGSALFQGQRLAEPAVRRFHEQLNNEEFAQIYDGATDGFRAASRKTETIKVFAAVHRKLGNAGEFRLNNMNVNATSAGTFIEVVYKTQFSNGSALETFIWRKSSQGLVLHRYNINSTTLIVN